MSDRLSDHILERAKQIRMERYGKRKDISSKEEEGCVHDAALEIRQQDAERRKKSGQWDGHTGHVQGRS